MATNAELYLLPLIHNLGFLKDEMTYYHPHMIFSQSRHGFVTYKMDQEYSLEEIHDLPIIFTLGKGLLLEQGAKETLEERLAHFENEYQTITIHRWDLVEEVGEMGDRKNRGNVLDFIRIDKDEYIIGVRLQIRGDFAPYSGPSPIPMLERSPSHAYQKLGEAFKHFRPLVGHDEVFLDIGAAPGGSSYYLLEKGFRVIAVDPLDLHPNVKEDFPVGLLVLKQKFGELKAKHLKGLPPVDWVIVDLDLGARKVLPRILKIMSKLEECNGLIMTIKMNRDMNVVDIKEIDKLTEDYGFTVVKKGQLPSHEKEFCLFATKMDT